MEEQVGDEGPVLALALALALVPVLGLVPLR